MKKYLAGFILGTLLTTGLTVFADEVKSLIAEKATFEVFVGNEKFESDKPIAVINGSTYLPLKDTGEALGVPVQWNEKDRRVEIGTVEEIAKTVEEITKEVEVVREPKPVSTSKQNEQFGTYSNTKTYYFQTELFAIDNKGKHALISYQNEQYIPLNLFSAVLKKEADNWLVDIRGEKSPEIYVYMGTTYVKLSSLELKARIEGDTAYIEAE